MCFKWGKGNVSKIKKFSESIKWLAHAFDFARGKESKSEDLIENIENNVVECSKKIEEYSSVKGDWNPSEILKFSQSIECLLCALNEIKQY